MDGVTARGGYRQFEGLFERSHRCRNSSDRNGRTNLLAHAQAICSSLRAFDVNRILELVYVERNVDIPRHNFR